MPVGELDDYPGVAANGFAYGCTCVEHISDRLLVEADEGDHNALLRREPTDDPHTLVA